MPRIAPKNDNIKLSVKTCRATRLSDTPKAVRRAISFCRLTPWASMSPVIFEQAINSTNPTAPNRTATTNRYWLTYLSLNSVTAGIVVVFSSGCSANQAFWMWAKSARAWLNVTPGFNRPKAIAPSPP